jgi:hypothetical protein
LLTTFWTGETAWDTEKNIVTLALRNDYIGIYTAFAVGNELDVQDALCDYIDRCGYNPDLKWYIRRMNWLV